MEAGVGILCARSLRSLGISLLTEFVIARVPIAISIDLDFPSRFLELLDF